MTPDQLGDFLTGVCVIVGVTLLIIIASAK
jgi:hypothetical protein